LITLQPGYAPGDYPNSNGLQLNGGFLSWGYTPHGSIIRGLRITGFPGSGICMRSDGNIIQQNVIYSNGADGVCIDDGNGNTVGALNTSPDQLEGNSIYSNGLDGISVEEINAGDAIPPPAGNTVLGNSIYGNGKLGIDLGGDGLVTANKYQGGPTSPLVRPVIPAEINFRVNYPTLDIATIAGAQPSRVEGYLLSWRSTTFRIEVFVNDSTDPSGYGEENPLLCGHRHYR